MFEKPCRRPTLLDGSLPFACLGVVRRTQRRRLADAAYCSKSCAAHHQMDRGINAFQLRTREMILRTAAKAGRTRGERAKRRKLLAVVAKLESFLPKEWMERSSATDVARVKALVVRAYLEGKEDGYQAGHTKAWRERAATQKHEAA